MIPRWLRLSLALGLLAVLAWIVDPAVLVDLFRRAEPTALAMGFALAMVATAVSAAVFQRFLRLCGLPMSYLPVLATNLAGDLYAVTVPGGMAVGGAFRLVRLARTAAEIAKVGAALVANRLQEIALQLGLAFLPLPFLVGRLPGLSLWAVVLGGAATAAFTAYVAVFHPGTRRLVLRLAAPLLRRGTRRRRKVVRGLAALRAMRAATPASHAPVLALGTLRHAISAFAFVAFARALDSPVDLATALWARGLVGVAMLLPVTIAGIGLREGGYVALLAILGIPPAQALALSLLMFATQLVNALLGAAVELFGRR